jgi:hypothetical protein
MFEAGWGNTIKTGALAVATITALAAGPAQAQGVEATRSVTVFIGTGVGLSGNVIEEASGRVAGTPATFVEQAFSNHYSDGLRVRFSGAYGLNFNTEVFGTYAYGRLNGTERTVGSVGGYPLRARFATARVTDLEGGLRYYFQPEGPTRVYANGAFGFRFLDEITTTLRVVDLGLTYADVEYFDNSTLFIFGGDMGISREVAEHVSLGAEIGVRYQPKPTRAVISIGSGVENINDTGSRWSLPVSVFATYRF